MRTLGKLFLLFTVVTVVEWFLLLKLAEYTSWWVTIATVIVPGVVGAWLAKREGARAIRQIRDSFVSGAEPSRAIMDGALVLIASAFLITPGVLTDITGLLLLIPPVRARVRQYVGHRVGAAVKRRINEGSINVVYGNQTRSPFADGPFEVIDAEDIQKPEVR